MRMKDQTKKDIANWIVIFALLVIIICMFGVPFFRAAFSGLIATVLIILAAYGKPIQQ